MCFLNWNPVFAMQYIIFHQFTMLNHLETHYVRKGFKKKLILELEKCHVPPFKFVRIVAMIEMVSPEKRRQGPTSYSISKSFPWLAQKYMFYFRSTILIYPRRHIALLSFQWAS